MNRAEQKAAAIREERSRLITRAADVSNEDFREWYLQAYAEGLSWRGFLAEHNLEYRAAKVHLRALMRLSPEFEKYLLPTRKPRAPRALQPVKEAVSQTLDPAKAKVKTGFRTSEEMQQFLDRLKHARTGAEAGAAVAKAGQ